MVAYLLGSLPFGLWLARSEGVDLRATGSGNIGATNVLRTTGRMLAAVVLALDSSKGVLAVWLARLLNGEIEVMVGCAVAVVVGHMWPIWAGFRGGKGVATAAGAWALVAPVAVVWSVVVFVLDSGDDALRVGGVGGSCSHGACGHGAAGRTRLHVDRRGSSWRR